MPHSADTAPGDHPLASFERRTMPPIAWLGASFGALYVVLFLTHGEGWLLAMGLFALFVGSLATAQIVLQRYSFPGLMVAALVSTIPLLPVLPERERVAVGMAMAVGAGMASFFTVRPARFGLLVLTIWSGQLLFPETRHLGMGHQAAVYLVLTLGLGAMVEALQSSRRRFRELFDEAPISLWEEDFSGVEVWLRRLRLKGVTDLSAYLDEHPGSLEEAVSLIRVLGVNPAAAKLVGVDDAADLLGPLRVDTVTPATRPSMVAQLETIWNGRPELTTEVRGRAVDGAPLHVHLHWSAALTDEGRPDYGRVMVSISDISDLTAAEEALRQQEHRLRAVVDAAPLVLWAIDPDGTFTLAEGSALAALGEDPESIVGTSAFDRYAEDPVVLEMMEQALAGEPAMRVVDRPHVKWQVRMQPVFGTAGEVEQVIGISFDVTEIRDIERALEHSERRYRMVVQNTSDLLCTVDADGRLGFVSASAESLLGRRALDLEGVPFTSLIHPDDARRVAHIAATTPHGASTPPVRHRVRHADGSWRWFEARGTNQLDDPEIPAWVVSARDVTDQVAADTALQAAKEAAEVATRVKSELLANVSHEIRTPMSAILGMTELALGTDLDAEQRDYLRIVHSSSESLLTLINDLLDFSKMEAGRLDLESIPFRVRDTVYEALATVDGTAAPKGISLVPAIAESVPTTVVGDPWRLRQVLLNLLGNAVKFTDHGRVDVRVDVDDTGDGEVVLRFSVTDTGIGIEPEHLGSIFESFSQADGSTSRHYGGTGLGLAICRELVALMGGEIEVESEPGAGSVFTFAARLGVSRGAAPALPAVEPDPGIDGTLHVLVADDSATNRTLVRRILERAGHTVTAVASGAEAMGAFRSDTFDLVLMDVQMPGVDGLAATRRIRRAPGGLDVPIIALTAHAMAADRERCLAAGMDDYLAKPFRAEQLLRVISAAVRESRALQALDRGFPGPPALEGGQRGRARSGHWIAG
jgi:PAS domain S-box-containing protein